jgi:hypothetical protein
MAKKVKHQIEIGDNLGCLLIVAVIIIGLVIMSQN